MNHFLSRRRLTKLRAGAKNRGRASEVTPRRSVGSFGARFVPFGDSVVDSRREVAVPAPVAGVLKEQTKDPLSPKTKRLKKNDYVPADLVSPAKIGCRLNFFV